MDLKKYMESIPQNKLLEPTLVKSYLHQITQGILFCHARRTMHRDLKPQNLLIDKQGVIKLADFGLARSIVGPDGLREGKIDLTNNVITMWYKPPELLLGAVRYSSGVDIWSVGKCISCIICFITLFFTIIIIFIPLSFHHNHYQHDHHNDHHHHHFIFLNHHNNHSFICFIIFTIIFMIGCVLAELELGRPLFPGKTEAEQLDLICRTLGIPNEKTWINIEKLPNYENMILSLQQKYGINNTSTTNNRCVSK
jgi:serine/threonine protein kinase